MKPGLRKILIWSGAAIAIGSMITGLYLYYKQQVKLALQYCYKVSNIKLRHFQKNSFLFELFVKVQNKSNFTVTINGYNLDVYLNEKKVANVISSTKYTILENGISELSFEVDFDPSKIFDKDYITSLISYAILDQSKIVLYITGYLNVTMDFIKIRKMKFDYKTNIQEIVNSQPDANVKCDIV
jgi:LEA14-like dessication related protein